MADYTWTGAIDGDLDKAGNYTVGGSVATSVPGAGDTLDLNDTFTNAPDSGSSDAGAVAFSSTGIYTFFAVFNGHVTLSGYIYGNTFNGLVESVGIGSIYGGVFNNNVDSRAGFTLGGIFNADLIAQEVAATTINHRLSFDNGTTWLYSPNSSAVAPASKVLTGTSNLGTAGTLKLPPAGTQSMGVGF